MAEAPEKPAESELGLEGGTYEILRARLNTHAQEWKGRLAQLNQARREVFGALPTSLLATERITTQHNCIPRDMASVGRNRFLFGYNVQFGLKTETDISDVFNAYECRDLSFHQISLDLIGDDNFLFDFKQLYKYYRKAVFVKFSFIGPHLYMVFRIGQSVTDIKTFKWACQDGRLNYLGNRSDHEFHFPPQHQFEWVRTHRDLHRSGPHPHISIADRLFVETIGGDLTIKVEDNTASGSGIYSEPVDHPDQTLDDAEVFYAVLGNLILLKIRPYQETRFRHFVYNEKLQEIRRIDTIQDSCVLLPEDHGIIFANGYYLQLGECKQFPSTLTHMMFERRTPAPNGEDYLYVFYNRLDGIYVLMSYNVIEQRVQAPIVCNGFSTFENGELAFFQTKQEPVKHHAIQIWQTPYRDRNLSLPEKSDSRLFKIGNPAIVHCLAEGQELLTLLTRDDTYAGLYVDIVKTANTLLDSYFWLGDPEACDLKGTLTAIKDTAAAAIDEFEKVARLRRQAAETLARAERKTRDLLEKVHHGLFEQIGDFVESLAQLRALRGELISLKETRYINLERVQVLEREASENTESLSSRCVAFLLEPKALQPYQNKVSAHAAAIETLVKVIEANQLAKAIAGTAAELEMLIEVVSNLKIEDATQTTRILDSISAIYAPLNQIKVALSKRKEELLKVEGAAQFNSQIRLLDQSVTNYLEICDAPDKCDAYLNKVLVELEELESRFAELPEYTEQLAEKREDLQAAFESRKLGLEEARQKRAAALLHSAERILKGIQHRVDRLESIDAINGYCAGDLMVDKIRDIIQKLLDLQDSVKAGDIQGRLKTIREDAIRQLKDRQELFVEGPNIIQLGKHKFTVNTQPLELTLVFRNSQPCCHLTGTNYFEPISDSGFLETEAAWNQELPSETGEVYRAEYLAFQMLRAAETAQAQPNVDGLSTMTDPERLATVQQFMATRYSEGYVKGLHDQDASKILKALSQMWCSIGLLRYHTQARACASVFWQKHQKQNPVLAAKLEGFRLRRQLFTAHTASHLYVKELQEAIGNFLQQTGLFQDALAEEAAEYLFADLTTQPRLAVSRPGANLYAAFLEHLKARQFLERFQQARQAVDSDLRSTFHLIHDWLNAFLLAAHTQGPFPPEYLEEGIALILRAGPDLKTPPFEASDLLDAPVQTEITGLAGSHPVIHNGTYLLNYNVFMRKLSRHERETVPRFRRFQELKKELIDRKRQTLRLDAFRPRVLTSFVRNRLIDRVYLPLIGDNLARQIGIAGEQTRTDRSGLLLIISPPGYGKTTLMEYIANRLGIVFIKINGPALGHQVTSLDPAEARHASAREELEKLNLSFEMGDNVMIYLDDIQHCHPELLQKFISLCDAQRRIEGVLHGRARTYDLRGKKVCVVMAGNPYTESGARFKIPDMLANRADTFNLGDIVAGAKDVFETSYLENALTSNPILHKLSNRSQKDVYAIIKMAQKDSREGVELEGSYAAEELNEMVSVMRKLMRLRDVVLRVNQEYIRSAAQAEAYRTEPAFKLQGSYRNMNRMAERVLPIMNEEEIAALIEDHYRNEAQTLTTGAEANLLKFHEMMGTLTDKEAQRWADIKKTFKRNLFLQTADQQDPVGRVVTHLASFSEGLESMKSVLSEGFKKQQENATFRLIDPSSPADYQIASVSADTLRKIWELVEQDRKHRDSNSK